MNNPQNVQPEKDYTFAVAEQAVADKDERRQEFKRHKVSKKQRAAPGLRPIIKHGRQQYNPVQQLRGIRTLADIHDEDGL